MRAAASASRIRAIRTASSGLEDPLRYFSATCRRSRESSARKTSPMPPRPIRPRTTYGPIRSPGAICIGVFIHLHEDFCLSIRDCYHLVDRREETVMRWIQNAGQDVRFAVRLLTKERWFTAASIAALALGIGVTGMMVTIINGYNFAAC